MTRYFRSAAHLKCLDLRYFAASKIPNAEYVVWNSGNANPHDMQRDDVGWVDVRSCFETNTKKHGRTFQNNPVSATTVMDKLVVVQSRNTLTFECPFRHWDVEAV